MALLISTYVLTVAVLVATGLPFVKTGIWWIRILDFPRVLVALVGLGALIGWGVAEGIDPVLRYAASGALVIAMAAQLIQIAPFTRLHPKESLAPSDSGSGEEVVLFTANVLMSNRETASDCRTS